MAGEDGKCRGGQAARIHRTPCQGNSHVAAAALPVTTIRSRAETKRDCCVVTHKDYGEHRSKRRLEAATFQESQCPAAQTKACNPTRDTSWPARQNSVHCCIVCNLHSGPLEAVVMSSCRDSNLAALGATVLRHTDAVHQAAPCHIMLDSCAVSS